MERIAKRFGDFIKEKRTRTGTITLKDMSERLGMSLSLLSDIENNRRKPFDTQKMEIFAKEVSLTDEEKNEMYDLAGRDNGGVPADIEEMFMYEKVGDMARLALRKTIAGELDLDDWKEFIRQNEKNKR